LLYDVKGVRQTTIPFESIPDVVKKATLAIEDASFYKHQGFQPTSIIRALITDVLSGEIRQGGSTITQQVVKNSLLTRDRTLTRKIKELILAVKLEKAMTKDQILNVYLNQSPYGGNIYGVQEAAKAYYRKDIKDIGLAEAAYLAALPRSPNYYSPYGSHLEELEQRKNLVLKRMLDENFIEEADYNKAKDEKVVFYEKINQGIKAPHFVFWLIDYLNERYGKENIDNNNFKVISTIDWNLQQKVEELAKKYGEENEVKFKAQNTSVVVIDPTTGQILALVGSRDYFNQDIEGNFNVATAHRQPGSSFKPFVYATAFNKGYTDKTVVFDLKTEFNTNCSPTSQPLNSGANCYSPQNYDGKYAGPITLRDALGQSRNIPAIKVLYLAGITDSLETAKKMGITSLTNKNQYGLTLVLGGGEVSLLEMTGAYGVFATDGVKHEKTGTMKIIGPQGETLEEFKPNNEGTRVLPESTARLISDILSDDKARQPIFGYHSLLYFSDRQVAVKTGTTNDYRDAWIIGYTPNIVIGAWAGNNDNSPMSQKAAAQVISPLWHAVMQECFKNKPDEKFIPPMVNYDGLKPILRGFWQGNETEINSLPIVPDQTSNQMEFLTVNTHSILYWIDKNNPLGPTPTNPERDPQFNLWEYPVQKWLKSNPQPTGQKIIISNQIQYSPEIIEQVSFTSPQSDSAYKKDDQIQITLKFPLIINLGQIDYFLNNEFIGSVKNQPFNFVINPDNKNIKTGVNELKAVIYDKNKNSIIKTTVFNID